MVRPMGEARASRILVVDDDVALTGMLRDYLGGEGFVTDLVHNGEDAVAAACSGEHDAVILDVMLPGLSGIEALRLIRRKSDVPILMLTAKGDDIDRVVGLELGADDYLAKPFLPRELVARLRAVLRRSGRREREAAGTVLRFADLGVDTEARSARVDERQLDLTASELNLLAALLRAGKAVATKEELSQQVLGRPHAAYDRSIDVHVSNLRHKLAAARSRAAIETVRGVGYRLSDAPR
jgi:two-component system, OmpR family, response regulator